MKTFQDFTGLYSLVKSVCTELKPVAGSRMDKLYEIVRSDEHRAESYQKVKKIIDDYHKRFIDMILSGFTFPYDDNKKKNSLSEFYSWYCIGGKGDQSSRKKTLALIQGNLRKELVSAFTSHPAYKRISKKELIREDLPHFVEGDQEKTALIAEFFDFTTYFTGFHENRLNMYSADEKSTAIAYRLVNENLPRFVDNMHVFDIVCSNAELQACVGQLEEALQPHLKGLPLSAFFKLSGFNEVLTQKQIDLYNVIIGGYSKKGDTGKVQGLNEYINLYNQQHKDSKIAILKPLYKQILSNRESLSWLPEAFVSDDELLRSVNSFYQELYALLTNADSSNTYSLPALLLSLKDDADLDRIYLPNDLQLTHISQKLFDDWGIIRLAIEKDYEKSHPQKKKSAEKYEEDKEKYIKSLDSVSIGYLNRCLALFDDAAYHKPVESYFTALGVTDTKQDENLLVRMKNLYADASSLLTSPYPSGKNILQDEPSIAKIKALLDSVKELQHFIKPLLGKGNESDKDERFYGEFAIFWDAINMITPLYNKVRNYLTRKPYSTDKIKLNFENSILLNGWDLNKEKDYTGVLLRDDKYYYLGIMDKGSKKILDPEKMPVDGECFEKMEYKFFKDLTMMVPKCSTQLNAVKEHFESSSSDYVLSGRDFKSPLVITKEIYDLNNKTYNGKKKFQIDYLRQTNDTAGFEHAVWVWIEFCLKFLSAYSSTVDYDLSSLKPVKEYKQLDDFYRDVNKLLYKVSFRKVSKSYIYSLVEKGQLFLFQIYNKDFSPYSKGTPNMHTLYWKMVFDENNLKNVVYKLNGQAEVFFRRASLKYDRPTHPANLPIKNKNVLNERPESVFNYDLIKDKRYTEDKFQFHAPITLNMKGLDVDNINDLVNSYLQQTDDVHIIGIDRGERNLLYLVVIDKKGNIVEQYSLNRIINGYDGREYCTDYHDLLLRKEKSRDEARKSWTNIENIKELKEGYLSQVIRKIADLMVKYRAIVVLGDLNAGFKRSRQKVESQIYQKFEKMLIDKLNYLVDKKQDIKLPGGLLHAYQLTNKFKSFKDLGRQSGFLFYTEAWNTSKIDPSTGFVNLFDTRYENISKAQSFFSKFDTIRYNPEKDWFEFSFDYGQFTQKAVDTRTAWTLCSYGPRIETFRSPENNNQWGNREIDLTAAFKDFFNGNGIDLTGDLKEAICARTDKHFFYNEGSGTSKGLLQLFKLLLQMRNSVVNSDIDYLVSPAIGMDGRCFDSRKVDDNSLPENADANGAYNIARKGLLIIDKIKKCNDLKSLDLRVSRKEWLQFAQGMDCKE